MMNKSHTLEVNKLIHRIGLKYGLRDIEVREIVESQFRFIYETIQKLNLDEQEKEEIELTKTNFLLKHIGKIYTTPGKVQNLKNRLKQYGKNREDCERECESSD